MPTPQEYAQDAVNALARLNTHTAVGRGLHAPADAYDVLQLLGQVVTEARHTLTNLNGWYTQQEATGHLGLPALRKPGQPVNLDVLLVELHEALHRIPAQLDLVRTGLDTAAGTASHVVVRRPQNAPA